jgi:hypothetical protein
MAWCIIESKEASCKAICLGFKNVDHFVSLSQQVIIVKKSIMILAGSEENVGLTIHWSY